MSEMTWFVQGRDDGPSTVEGLAALVRTGEIMSDTQVRDGAGGDWSAAGERLPGLFAAPPTVSASPAPATGWTDTSPHPWRRYAARILDNMVVGLMTWWIIGLVAYSVAPAESEAFFSVFDGPLGGIADQLLTLLCAIPGTAALIGLTGLTPGKWIFGVRVLREGRPIGFPAALNRELEIWVRGLACGIPLISLLTLSNSYNELTTGKRRTAWDLRQGNIVTHRDQSVLATIGMWIAVGCLIAAAAIVRFASAS